MTNLICDYDYQEYKLIIIRLKFLILLFERLKASIVFILNINSKIVTVKE